MRLQLGTVVLALSVLVASCECGKKADEEILKERVDTTSVHLYLAAKIAVLKADQSEEARVARDQLVAAISSLRGQPKAGEDTREMTTSDFVELAKALYSLSEEGKELLESGNEKNMQPILPKLFAPSEPLAKMLDLNTEHALLLTGMFVLKFHPDAPTPLPPELMLYEAWMTDSDKLQPAFRTIVRTEKAMVYSGNELCDLAAKEAAGTDRDQAELDQLLQLFETFGAKANIDDKQLESLYAGARALAHGAAAFCHQKRGEGDKAVPELDKTLQALDDAGVPEGETALAKAYVAFEQDEQAKAKAHLETARDDKGTDPDTKKDIEAILEQLDDDPNVFEEKLGKAFFTLYLAKIVLRHLDRAGVFDPLKDAELVKAMGAYLTMISDTMTKAADAIPGKSLIDDIKGIGAGD